MKPHYYSHTVLFLGFMFLGLFIAHGALAQVDFVFGRARVDNLLSVESVKDFIVVAIDLMIAIGIIAMSALVVYAGIRLMLALGNAAQVTAAKSILLWAVIGLVVMLLAKAIMLAVTGFVGAGGSGFGGDGGDGGDDLALCSVVECSACGDQIACDAAGCAWDVDLSTCSQPIIAGSAPMLFVNAEVSGDGTQSSIAAAAAPFDGFYTASQLASAEYIAKLLDGAGNVLFAHAFNAPNVSMGEVPDAEGNIGMSEPVGGQIDSIDVGIVLPAVPGASTLEINDALGRSLVNEPVAQAVETSHRRYAARHGAPYAANAESFFLPKEARAAGGVLRIGVLGVGYPSDAEFTSDWQAFQNRLLTTDPFSAISGSIEIRPIGLKPLNDPALNCITTRRGACGPPAYTCNGNVVTGIAASQGSFDTTVTFIRSNLDGGCALFDASINTYNQTHRETDLGVGGFAFVTVAPGHTAWAGWAGVHEFAHAFGSILDEYPNSYFTAGRNCDASNACPSWNNATYNIASCVAGCAAYPRGGGPIPAYKSSANSIMGPPPDNTQFNAYSRLLLRRRFARISIGTDPTGDTVPPTAQIITPRANAVIGGTFRLWANANDNVGTARVEFFANDVRIGIATQGTDPRTFWYAWDTNTVPGGAYGLRAVAYDAQNNRGRSPVLYVTVSNAACIPQCLYKCGGDNGCGGTCANTCTSPHTACQEDNTTCCVPGTGGACNENPCMENMTVRCDGKCAGGKVIGGGHLECIKGIWTSAPNTAGACQDQDAAAVEGNPCGNTLSLTVDKSVYAAGEAPVYTITGALPNAQIFWSSWRDGVSTGEDNVFYGHVTDGAGNWMSPGFAWAPRLIGAWIKEVSVGGMTAHTSFALTSNMGRQQCGTLNGRQIYCLQPGESYVLDGLVAYGSGLPSSPILGLGSPTTGFIPASHPFRCTATGERNAIEVRNEPDGKICEVLFDVSNTIPTTGLGIFTVTADAAAPEGDYPFGLTASPGATHDEPEFYLRVKPAPACNPFPFFIAGVVNPTTVAPHEYYTLSCNYGRADIDCIYPMTDVNNCVFTGFIGTSAQFSCQATDATGPQNNFCTLGAGSYSNCCARGPDDAGTVTVAP